MLASTTVFAYEKVRYYDVDGQTYRETRQVVREPVREVHYQTRQQTFYRRRPESVRNITDTYYVPVTKYRWEVRWHNKQSLLQAPHLAYHAVPYTVWEIQQRTRQVIESAASWVPETRSVRVPVPKLRFVEKEEVSRVAVGPSDSRMATFTTTLRDFRPSRGLPVYGGIARLDGDPPRQGSRLSSDGWRARR